jgi:hypothetical protein
MLSNLKTEFDLYPTTALSSKQLLKCTHEAEWTPSQTHRKSGIARNRTRTSGPVARNSEYQTTEAVAGTAKGAISQLS